MGGVLSHWTLHTSENEAHTTIPIPGIEPTIFIAMLQYIYTGRVYSKPADSTSSSE